MNIKSLDHIGIAVKNIENVLPFFKDMLNLSFDKTEEVKGLKVKVAKLKAPNVIIELIEPQPGEETVTKFIEKRGEGIHHICFATDDINKATADLISQGYKPRYPEPQIGAGGKKVNFLSPKDTFGVLIEIISSG